MIGWNKGSILRIISLLSKRRNHSPSKEDEVTSESMVFLMLLPCFAHAAERRHNSIELVLFELNLL